MSRVGRSANGGPGSGQTLVLGLQNGMADSKIHRHRFPGHQHDLGRLHVPVDDPFLMAVRQGVGDLPYDLDGILDGELGGGLNLTEDPRGTKRWS